jgi:hypothetical protein
MTYAEKLILALLLCGCSTGPICPPPHTIFGQELVSSSDLLKADGTGTPMGYNPNDPCNPANTGSARNDRLRQNGPTP